MSTLCERMDDARQDAYYESLETCPRCHHKSLEVKRWRNDLPPTFEARCWCLTDSADCECDYESDGTL